VLSVLDGLPDDKKLPMVTAMLEAYEKDAAPGKSVESDKVARRKLLDAEWAKLQAEYHRIVAEGKDVEGRKRVAFCKWLSRTR
jgi:hypothetical protein